MTQAFKVALCGGIRSGKDTVADHLVKNYKFKQFAFGDGIRELCREYFPDRMSGGKDRALLQGVGQDLRKYDPDIWVNWMLAEIGSANYNDLNVVISDLRQPNEYAVLRAAGYTIVRINASEAVRLERALAAGDVFDTSTLMHETESYFSWFVPDFEITNEGSLDDLLDQVDRLATFLTKRGGER